MAVAADDDAAYKKIYEYFLYWSIATPWSAGYISNFSSRHISETRVVH